MLRTQTLKGESLCGVVTQVQNKIVTLVASDRSDGGIRILGGMASIFKKVTYSHHRFAIKFSTSRMLAEGNPNKLTG